MDSTKIRRKIKNFWKRLEFWLLWFVIAVFIDQWLKEAYFFDPIDLFNLVLTHEKIIVTTLVFYVIVKVWRWKKKT